MKKIKYQSLVDRIIKGETVYLLNTGENTAVKYKDGQIFLLKKPGEEPFSVTQDNKTVNDALLESVTLTEEEFLNF